MTLFGDVYLKTKEKLIVQIHLPVTISNIVEYSANIEKLCKYYERLCSFVYTSVVMSNIKRSPIRRVSIGVHKMIRFLAPLTALVAPALVAYTLKKSGYSFTQILARLFGKIDVKDTQGNQQGQSKGKGENPQGNQQGQSKVTGENPQGSQQGQSKVTGRSQQGSQQDRPPQGATGNLQGKHLFNNLLETFEGGASSSKIGVTEVVIGEDISIQYFSHITAKPPDASVKDMLTNSFVVNQKALVKKETMFLSTTSEVQMFALRIPCAIISSSELDEVEGLKCNLMIVDFTNDIIRTEMLKMEGSLAKTVTFVTRLSEIDRKPDKESITLNTLLDLMRGVKKV